MGTLTHLKIYSPRATREDRTIMQQSGIFTNTTRGIWQRTKITVCIVLTANAVFFERLIGKSDDA